MSKKTYRQFVGGKWNEISNLQFQFLKDQGMVPESTLLDIACGSLRLGHLAIPYLLPSHYYGIEKEEWRVQEGIEKELGGVTNGAQFSICDDFDIKSDRKFDFMMAQSLFTHLTLDDISKCLGTILQNAKDDTKFFATFFESDGTSINPEESHPHKAFRYSYEQMRDVGSLHGWFCYYYGNWNHPRGQKMILYKLH